MALRQSLRPWELIRQPEVDDHIRWERGIKDAAGAPIFFGGVVILRVTYLSSPVIRLCPSPWASAQSILGAIPEEDDSVKSNEAHQSLMPLFDTRLIMCRHDVPP